MKLELIIPTKLSEIPLKHYQKFLAVAEKTNDEVFLAEKMIECFCGIELKEVVNIPFKEIEALSIHFSKMFEQQPEFKTSFKLGGTEFGFIPNLENISWGEYIDLEANISDLKNFHKAMAVMYRPIVKQSGDKYQIEPYVSSASYAEVMEFAPLDIALAAKVFFWTLESELLTATLNFLETEIMTSQEAKTNLVREFNSQNNGVGINQFMQSLKEISQNLTMSPSFDLQKHLPSLLLKSKKTKLSNVN